MKNIFIKKQIKLTFEPIDSKDSFINASTNGQSLNSQNDIIKYKNLTENIGAALAVFYPLINQDDTEPYDYRFIDLNTNFEKMVFVSKENLLKTSIREIFPYGKGLWMNEFNRLITEEETNVVLFEIYSVEFDKYFKINAYIQEDYSIVVIFYDITNEKNIEKGLEHQNSIFQSLRKINQLITQEKEIDSILEKITSVLTDKNGYINTWIAYYNEGKYCKYFYSGFTEKYQSVFEEFIAKQDHPFTNELANSEEVLIINDPPKEASKSKLFKEFLDRSVLQFRLKFSEKLYGIIGVSLSRKYKIDNQEIALFKEIAEDISYALYSIEIEKLHKKEEEQVKVYAETIKSNLEELKIINNELIKAKDKAEESDKLKSIFLANMSHEIRTPMNGIIGFCELMKNESISTEKRKQFSNIIIDNAQRLTKLIDDIINFSIIESSKIDVLTKELNLNSLLSELYFHFSTINRERNIELILTKGLPDNECNVFLDDIKVNTIIEKLLENAYKYTNNGHIKFGYIIEQDEIKFYVSDTGIGIDKKYKDLIFEKFRQIEEGLSRLYGGAGLGLTIAKKIIEILGGKIWVESEDRKGTTFYFTLPLVKSNFHAIKDKGNVASQNDKYILIVEDDIHSYRYLYELLTQRNYQILHSDNGEKAIDLCRTNNNIQLVLMDLRLPKMDGYIAAKSIKEFRRDLPIIAQTAYTFTEDKNKSIEAGCDDFISKPYDDKKIISLIEKYLVMKN